MDKHINYYNTLGLRNTATAKEIKLAYYRISKEVHPDKGGDEDEFKKITDAYKVLSSVKDRSEFDTKSKFGSSYDELTEYLDFEFKNDAKNWDKDIYEEFIRRDQLNIIVHIDETFNGTVEYERWVYCKDCNGCGKDNNAKISVGFSKSLEYFFDDMDEAIKFISDENISNFTTEAAKATDMLSKLDKLAEKGMLASEYEKLKVKYENKGDGSFIILKVENNLKRNLLELSDECDFCFEENNYVVTDNGFVKINNIKIGDMVLSQDNTYQIVTNILQRSYTGGVLDLDVSGIKINGVTNNHKFNIVRFDRNNQGRININKYKMLEVSAENLTISDFIVYQNKKYSPKNKVILQKTHNREPKEISIDLDFVKFVACYIAEGNTRGDRVVVFTFHREKDISLINFINDYIGKIGGKVKILEDREEWGDKVSKLEIYNSQLAKFLKLFCGQLAENKYIHTDILGNSDEDLLNTLLLCDGSVKKNTRTYTTISKKLAYQVFHLSQNLGYNSSVNVYDGYIDNNGVNHKIYYRVYITKSSKMGLYRKVIKEGVCLKIRDIKKRNVVSTDVYNITVDNTHKYTIDGLLVNNCDGTGKWGEVDCFYCSGSGIINGSGCKTCKGEKRILGKQKLHGIVIAKDEIDHKVEFMGNVSKDVKGKFGHLWLLKR